jgi:hypothetical protein
MFGFGQRKKDPISRFWEWFAANRDVIERDVRAVSSTHPASDLILHKLGGRLAQTHPDVVHEIGVHGDGQVELIISAGGIKAAFPTVSALIGAAPSLPGFKFTAFRPRVGPRQLQIRGKTVGFDQVRFRASPEGDHLGLELFIDAELDPMELRTFGYLLLDAALGEYDVETGIGSIGIQAGVPEDARPLADLPGEFDAFRADTVH